MCASHPLKHRLHGFKRSWSPNRHTFPRRQDRGPTESKLCFPPGHWKLPAPRHLRRVIAMLARLGVPDHRKEVGLLLHNEGRKEHVWHPVNPRRSLLVLPCPNLMANGHMQQPCPEKGRMKGGSGPSGMQVLVMPLRPEGSGWEQGWSTTNTEEGRWTSAAAPRRAVAAGAMACPLTMLLLDYLPRKGAHQSHEGDASGLDSNGPKGISCGPWRVTHSDLLPERMGLLSSCWDSQKISLSHQLFRASSVFAEENHPTQITSPRGSLHPNDLTMQKLKCPTSLPWLPQIYKYQAFVEWINLIKQRLTGSLHSVL